MVNIVDLEEISTTAFFTVLRDDLKYLSKIGQASDINDYPHLYKLINYRLIDAMGQWVNHEVSAVEALGFMVSRIGEQVQLLLANHKLMIPLDQSHLEALEEDSILRKLLTA